MNIVTFPEHKSDDAKGGVENVIAQHSELLDTMMPFHIVAHRTGQILHAGPSFHKLMPDEKVVGTLLFDLLTIKRPAGLAGVADILAHQKEKLSINLTALPGHNLKGVAAGLGQGHVLIDISLGAGVMDVVSKCNLKNKDFSPADPTVEMIYMIEVQSFVYQQHKNQSHKLQGARVHAEEQAFTDALTGLANRRALENHMTRLLRRTKGNGFALMQIDLDFFKAVNDTHGHAAGDFVLQETARTLQQQMRATDLVARIGGDEFVIIMSEFGNESALQAVANRIIEQVRIPIPFEGVECQIGASIGATIVQRGEERTPDAILSDADRALYASKAKGRGVFHLDQNL